MSDTALAEDDTQLRIEIEGEEQAAGSAAESGTEPAEETGKDSEKAADPGAVETATAKADEEKEESLDPKAQEILNREIGKKVGKFRERERELEQQVEAERKAKEELEAKLPKDQRPEVPDLPELTDPEYHEKIAQRDEALKAQVEWDASEKARSEAELKAQQDHIAAQNETARKTLESFAKNAEDLNISEDELRNSMQALANHGAPDSAVMYLLTEPTGPQIGKYLAQNPHELEGLQGMTPQQVAVKIATEIKPRAMESRPKVETPPAPAETLSGGGAPEGDDGLAGATYE